MYSKTDVANIALGYMATSQALVDLDVDNSLSAKILRRFSRISLNTFLESHQWKLATEYAGLTLISEDHESGWKYEYGVPSDYLVGRQIAQEKSFERYYEIHDQDQMLFDEVSTNSGIRIYCDLPDAWIAYTRELPLDMQFPPYFAKGWAAEWAEQSASQIITSNYAKVKTLFLQEMKVHKETAVQSDISRSPRKKDPDSPFIAARY
jgi:hypothetical protein